MTLYPDCMVDIESMSLRPNAAIVSIGAVGFNFVTLDIGPKFYINISLESCQDAGLYIDADTVLWWMKQSDDARKALLRNPQDLTLGLTEFAMWLRDNCTPSNSVRMWANSPAFDLVIVGNAYHVTGQERPWNFRNECDYRTVRTLYPNVESDVGTGTHHNALDDALWQTEHLLKIRRTLKGVKK